MTLPVGIIVGIVLGVIVSVLSYAVFWFLRRYVTERDRKLRAHFCELRRGIVKDIQNRASDVRQSGIDLEIHFSLLLNEATPGWASFQAHFPALASQVEKVMEEAERHNQNCRSFCEQTERTLLRFPFILRIDVSCFLERWRQEYRQYPAPAPNLEQIRVGPGPAEFAVSLEGGLRTNLIGWGTTSDACEYRAAFDQVRNDEELKREYRRLACEADELKRQVYKVSDEMQSITEHIERYWPRKAFRKLGSCPICRRL